MLSKLPTAQQKQQTRQEYAHPGDMTEPQAPSEQRRMPQHQAGSAVWDEFLFGLVTTLESNS